MTVPDNRVPAMAVADLGHPRLSALVARGILESLLATKDVLGIALARSTDWTYVMTSETYERFVGAASILGRKVFDVLPETIASPAILEAIAVNGSAARAGTLLERTEIIEGSPVSIHVSITFLPVRGATADATGVLMLALDVSAEVQERRLGELFVALASDMSADRDETASIRASVAQASTSLGAGAASIFLLSPDGRRLHGALVGWDWTRTSFVAELENWPSVRRAIEADEPAYVTAASAQRAEVEWFERRGIKAAICAPMSAQGRAVGVLFFDYFAASASQVSLALAKRIADQCALLVERAARRSA